MEKNLQINFDEALSQFERAVKKFQLKKIIYRSVFRGKGLEFESYRNFEKDDDVSMIDWKASKRAGKLLAKQYVEERDMNIYFIVDVSNSMLFGSKNKLKAEYAAEIVGALSHLIIGSGDGTGMIMYSEKAKKILLPSRSKNQFYLITQGLADSSLYGGKLDFSSMIKYLLSFIKSPAVVILISDFLHISREVEKQLRLLAYKFETMALMIHDPLDEKMPDVNYKMYIQDPHSGRQMIVDPQVAAKKYAQITERQRKFTENIFNKAGIDLMDFRTDENFVVPLSSFLKMRAKGGARE